MKKFSDLIKSIEHQKHINGNNPVDMTKATNEMILDHFHNLILIHHRSGYSEDQQFYGGITKNIEDNLNRHHIDTYLGCVKVNSYTTACEIEQLLHDILGVYIGKRGSSSAGNGGDEESTIVYLANRKAKDFQE